MASIVVGLTQVTITNDKGKSLDLSLAEWLALLTGIKAGTYDPPKAAPVTQTLAKPVVPVVKNARPTYTGFRAPSKPSGAG